MAIQRAFSDWGGNVAAFVLVVVVNAWSNLAPINDQTMTEISARYPSLFTPAGFTFSIWGLIYLALLGFIVYQALPSQRSSPTIARIGPWFQVNCVANAAWLIAWHYDLLHLSLLIMLVMLITLVLIYRTLLAEIGTASFPQHLLVHLPFSLYTAWITVATIANISVIQTSYGWDGVGMTIISWTLLKLAVAGAIGATVVLRYGDAIFVLVIAWATYGIAVMQSATPSVSGAATVVTLLALLLAMQEGISRIRQIASPFG